MTLAVRLEQALRELVCWAIGHRWERFAFRTLCGRCGADEQSLGS